MILIFGRFRWDLGKKKARNPDIQDGERRLR